MRISMPVGPALIALFLAASVAGAIIAEAGVVGSIEGGEAPIGVAAGAEARAVPVFTGSVGVELDLLSH
jgi:hypothetical protein